MPNSEKPVLKEEKAVLKKKAVQPIYTAAQLAANDQAFHTSYAIVVSALKLAEKDNFTLEEANMLQEHMVLLFFGISIAHISM